VEVNDNSLIMKSSERSKSSNKKKS